MAHEEQDGRRRDDEEAPQVHPGWDQQPQASYDAAVSGGWGGPGVAETGPITLTGEPGYAQPADPDYAQPADPGYAQAADPSEDGYQPPYDAGASGDDGTGTVYSGGPSHDRSLAQSFDRPTEAVTDTSIYQSSYVEQATVSEQSPYSGPYDQLAPEGGDDLAVTEPSGAGQLRGAPSPGPNGSADDADGSFAVEPPSYGPQPGHQSGYQSDYGTESDPPGADSAGLDTTQYVAAPGEPQSSFAAPGPQQQFSAGAPAAPYGAGPQQPSYGAGQQSYGGGQQSYGAGQQYGVAAHQAPYAGPGPQPPTGYPAAPGPTSWAPPSGAPGGPGGGPWSPHQPPHQPQQHHHQPQQHQQQTRSRPSASGLAAVFDFSFVASATRALARPLFWLVVAWAVIDLIAVIVTMATVRTGLNAGYVLVGFLQVLLAGAVKIAVARLLLELCVNVADLAQRRSSQR
ncbi:MAG: DUF4282 domain-containing protein [Austwickia sp.]|nr:DUF4282 domain-containing protein [Actinomycetota bacterium]MCB1252422.1 DUF4282 domain-containing protein [Austwickia sp.]MCO5307973.1 DUF4282 domain-containing protein [Austwickia sp.]